MLIQLQEKGETLQEKEREVMEVKSRLEGEVTDLHRDLNDKKKVNIAFTVNIDFCSSVQAIM